jgi:hypothetical protein
LDEKTDDMIISVSREKIAHQIIQLKQDKSKLEALLSQKGGSISQANNPYIDVNPKSNKRNSSQSLQST